MFRVVADAEALWMEETAVWKGSSKNAIPLCVVPSGSIYTRFSFLNKFVDSLIWDTELKEAKVSFHFGLFSGRIESKKQRETDENAYTVSSFN